MPKRSALLRSTSSSSSISTDTELASEIAAAEVKTLLAAKKMKSDENKIGKAERAVDRAEFTQKTNLLKSKMLGAERKKIKEAKAAKKKKAAAKAAKAAAKEADSKAAAEQSKTFPDRSVSDLSTSSSISSIDPEVIFLKKIKTVFFK